MRILGALILTVTLVGCGSIANTQFDNIEAARYVDLWINARDTSSHCNNSDAVKERLPSLIKQADAALSYSSVKVNNPRITEAGNIITGLVVDLNKRYAESKPSVAYCTIKLTTIASAAEKVARSISRKEILSPIVLD